jgi:hypothetical protein
MPVIRLSAVDATRPARQLAIVAVQQRICRGGGKIRIAGTNHRAEFECDLQPAIGSYGLLPDKPGLTLLCQSHFLLACDGKTVLVAPFRDLIGACRHVALQLD